MYQPIRPVKARGRHLYTRRMDRTEYQPVGTNKRREPHPLGRNRHDAEDLGQQGQRRTKLSRQPIPYGGCPTSSVSSRLHSPVRNTNRSMLIGNILRYWVTEAGLQPSEAARTAGVPWSIFVDRLGNKLSPAEARERYGGLVLQSRLPLIG